MQTINVTVGGIPHSMTIVENAVVFSNKSGFSGCSKRVMFEYRSNLWYITEVQGNVGTKSANYIPAAHIVKMHQLLKEHIGNDHELPDNENLTFKNC